MPLIYFQLLLLGFAVSKSLMIFVYKISHFSLYSSNTVDLEFSVEFACTAVIKDKKNTTERLKK
jgi:hypothetical protein